MFDFFRREARLLALRRSLRKRAPPQFAYSSTNNYYVPTLWREDTKQSVLVDEITGCSIVGRLWSDNEFSEHFKIQINELSEWELKVTRFFGYVRKDFETTSKFIAGELTLSTERAWINEKFFQSLYNATLRHRDDRIAVLKKIVEMHYIRALDGVPILYEAKKRSIIQLETDHFGQRIYGHPKHDQISARFRLLIESLASSGDLEKVGRHDFKLSAKALVTISDYAQEERRHKDNVRQNQMLFWITVAIALATAAQAFSVWQSGTG
ncbi:hypothetical protein [Ruegeria arenilitoris]|uniref:hypothetical protein n=1 Tax=Ruegeria arenilitoris TaxID=1173585 RepID=UPI00147F9471|nr:hypothetical protein [Ruegeria arenilitoris]